MVSMNYFPLSINPKSIHFNEKKHVSAYIVNISVVTSQWLAKGVVHIFEVGYIFNHYFLNYFPAFCDSLAGV
jgi:hypothetical protein